MGKLQRILQHEAGERRRDFLLTFFDKEEGYETKQVNGWWLVKSWNGTSRLWQIAIYSQKAFDAYSKYNNQHRYNEYKNNLCQKEDI